MDQPDKLAAKAGVAAGYYWELLVRQAFVKGIGSIIIAFSLGLLALFMLRVVLSAFKKNVKENKEKWGNDDIIFVSTLIWLAIFSVLAIAIVTGINGIKHLRNPGYYALQDLIDQVRLLHK